MQSGLDAADPTDAVERRVSLRGRTLLVDDRRYELDGRGVVVIGAGKASLRIVRALEARIGPCIDDGMVVVPPGACASLERVDCAEATHPLPGPQSAIGADTLSALARGAAGRVVLTCFTGGSSALACAPPPSVSLEDKRDLHSLLLRCGATIKEINAVRKHVSLFKGGRLAALARPSPVVALTVSDVAGDTLDAISDPSVQDTTTTAEAIAVLQRHGLWWRVSPTIRAHLTGSDAESPRLDDRLLHAAVLVTGKTVCGAMAARARELGFETSLLFTAEGEARTLGPALVKRLGRVTRNGVRRPHMLLGCGGEATVTLDDSVPFGAGGPNQEVALSVALEFDAGKRIAAAFLDTDGRDGSGAHAGALVDGLTATHASEGGVDLQAGLATHRSGDAFARLGDAIATGDTGVNVNDLFVIATEGDEP